MKKQIITAILTAFLVAGAAFAAPLADVSTDASGVYFLTAKSGEHQLKVSGPEGFYYSKTSSAPSFSVADANGDGTYVWELVAIPSKAAEGDRTQIVSARSQSGAFTISGGSIVNPDLAESFEKAQTFTTDLIVQGSACVGIDCASSESFGFDTFRLKENNLRIHFDDTSSSASFPSNDWRITINDSSNGGAEYFAVEDATAGRTPFKIEAGAIANAVYVSAAGDVGVGTATPVVEVHAVDGNTPTLRLEQNGSSGFTPQTWDLAGNETNFFLRDVTNGSKLPFRVEPGAGDNELYIDSTGNIGMGTNNPEDALQVVSNTAANVWVKATSPGIFLEDSDASDAAIQASYNGNGNLFRMRGVDSAFAETVAGISLDTSSGVVGINCNDAAEAAVGARLVVGDGDSCLGTFSAIIPGNGVLNTSSRALKNNLHEVGSENILEKIAGIGVYTYDFIEGPKDRLGLMAEDFHQVFGRGSDKMISSQEVEMALWLAVQELTAQNQKLSEKLSGLEAQLAK